MMYRFQQRRFLRYENGKQRLKPVWTPWRTIEMLHKLPDMSEGLGFPSEMTEFRIVRADKTIWRSDHRQDHKYDVISFDCAS
jgi:hypothetical protein